MAPDGVPRLLRNLSGATECAHGISLQSFCQQCARLAPPRQTYGESPMQMILNPTALRVVTVTISEAAGDATRIVWEGFCVCHGDAPITPAYQDRAVSEQALAQLLAAAGRAE